MPEIFINYRTGDGDHLAATLDEALRNRFGDDAVFRDGRSIGPGSEYPHELLTNLRESRAVVVVVGPGWATAAELRREDDWVRREILEAHRYRIPIVPVLGDSSVSWLRRDQLPVKLSWLAEIQSLRYRPYHSATDLAHIGDELARLVPELTDASQQTAPTASGSTHNSVSGGNHGTFVQGRDVSVGGDIAGTVYRNNTGPFHTGSGDQNVNSPHFSGDGGTFVAGDNHNGVHHTFGGDRRRHSDGGGRR